MTQQKSTNERIGVIPARFQGALNATRPSRFQGVIGEGFSAWLGQRWGLTGRRALAPVAKSFRQQKNPFAFGRWSKPSLSVPVNYAFFPTLSLAVVLRPMASWLPAAALRSAPERSGGASLQVTRQLLSSYAFFPALSPAGALRPMASRLSAAALRSAPERSGGASLQVTRQLLSSYAFFPALSPAGALRPIASWLSAAALRSAPERLSGASLPIKRKLLSGLFLPPMGGQERGWWHSQELRHELCHEQRWMAFVRKAGAPVTNLSVARLVETLNHRAWDGPAAMLKLIERPPQLFQARLGAAAGRENQVIAARVPASGWFVSLRSTADRNDAGRAALGSRQPREAGLLAQTILTGESVRDEARELRRVGQSMAHSYAASPVLRWQTVMRLMTRAGAPNVPPSWPAPLPTMVRANPTLLTSRLTGDGRSDAKLTLAGANPALLAHPLPGDGRRAVKFALVVAKPTSFAGEPVDAAPRLAYAAPLVTEEATARSAASFGQMALQYQQREAWAARNMGEALRDLRQSFSDFKKAPVPAPAPPPIDQLTRQVYDELKRELRIERERRGL